MKKRLLALILTAALTLSSCGTSQQAETTTTAEPAAEVTTTVSDDAGETPVTTEKEAAETTAEEEKPAVIPERPTNDELTPAVWEVTDPESGNSLKMMGTIHIVPKSEGLVPKYVMDIYNSSDGVAVEYDISKIQTDMVVQIMYLSYFVLNDGTTIQDHLTPETYEKAKAHLTELGLYNESFESYNASYWESLVTSGTILGLDNMSESGIDAYFIGLSKEDGKEVRSIEALETQMNALGATSDAYCDYSINEMLKLSIDEFEEMFMALYNTWSTGDVDGYSEMESSSDEEMPEEIKADYELYNKMLLEDRNIGMADVAEEYIKNGDNIFYMVGFAHFCGEGSVIDLLEDRGYTVERIH